MRDNPETYSRWQVFLNYPFNPEFETSANALHFAVVAAGLVPLCAKDLSMPDLPRMDGISNAIRSCRYSVHDLSRFDQQGKNISLELGIAFAKVHEGQQRIHRCALFMPSGLDYHSIASDLSGFDPKQYQGDSSLVVGVYEWLRDVVRDPVFSGQSPLSVKRLYEEFQQELSRLEGSGKDGRPSHDESQELMFRLCEKRGWWDWRLTKAGKIDLRPVPLSLKSEVPEPSGR
jgi:hypothetical protein